MTRLRWAFSLGLFFSLWQTGLAEVPLTKDHWVANEGGYCGWCSIEMCGRFLDLPELRGLVAQKREEGYGATNFPNMKAFLSSKKIHHTYYNQGRNQIGYLVRPQAGRGLYTYLLTSRDKAEAKQAAWLEEGVSSQLVPHAIGDPSFLEEALAMGQPVIAQWPEHAVVLTHLDVAANEAVVWDPNRPEAIRDTAGWFLNQWNGVAIAVQVPPGRAQANQRPVPLDDNSPKQTGPSAQTKPQPEPILVKPSKFSDLPRAQPVPGPIPENVTPRRPTAIPERGPSKHLPPATKVDPAAPRPQTQLPVVRVLIVRHNTDPEAAQDAWRAHQAVTAAAKAGLPVQVVGDYNSSHCTAAFFQDWLEKHVLDQGRPGDTLILHTIGHGLPDGRMPHLGERDALTRALASVAEAKQQRILWWQLSCFACAGLPALEQLPEPQRQWLQIVASSSAHSKSGDKIQAQILQGLLQDMAQRSPAIDANQDGLVSAREMAAYLNRFDQHRRGDWLRAESPDTILFGPPEQAPMALPIEP
jgi:hypothetical protein